MVTILVEKTVRYVHINVPGVQTAINALCVYLDTTDVIVKTCVHQVVETFYVRKNLGHVLKAALKDTSSMRTLASAVHQDAAVVTIGLLVVHVRRVSGDTSVERIVQTHVSGVLWRMGTV